MVTLVIPVFNKVELTEQCLNSVLEGSTALSLVVVVDNASQDATPQLLRDFKTRFENAGIAFTIITNEKNLGFGSACNQGVCLAKADYVAILNNDTWLMKEWDQALITAIHEKKLDVVGPFFDERPLTQNESGELKLRAETFVKQNGVRYRKHFVPILMFFTQKSVEALKFDHGGIFDELFFVTYEDTDLLHRMRLKQMKYAQTSRCYIWHRSMGTRSQQGSLPLGYEAEGLKRFIGKWNFDPRDADHTFLEKIKRRYRKRRAARGLF